MNKGALSTQTEPQEASIGNRSRNQRLVKRLSAVLGQSDWEDGERDRYAQLMALVAEKDPPADPFGLYPRYGELRASFLDCAASPQPDGNSLETAFLNLYCHLHGYEVPYTPVERCRLRATGGYLSHCGGISPILKASPWIGPSSVVADFGAGNGLQGLLMQVLYPHRCTVQIEISSRMVEAGKVLQCWLGIEPERVRWVVGDVFDTSPAGFDFIYLYRPVRPVGEGRRFYEEFARQLSAVSRPVTVFSVADCLRPFLTKEFELFYSDGHLTCYRRR